MYMNLLFKKIIKTLNIIFVYIMYLIFYKVGLVYLYLNHRTNSDIIKPLNQWIYGADRYYM